MGRKKTIPMPPTVGTVARYIDPSPLTYFVLLDDGMTASRSFAFPAAGLCDLCSYRPIMTTVSRRGARRKRAGETRVKNGESAQLTNSVGGHYLVLQRRKSAGILLYSREPGERGSSLKNWGVVCDGFGFGCGYGWLWK